MFIEMIEFGNCRNELQNDIEEMIKQFICALKNNGQILSEHLLVRNKNSYQLYVETPKADSLKNIYDSIYVKKYRDNLSEIFTITVTQIGVNADSQEYCSCGKKTTIEMQTFANDIDSVFTCCTCGKPIALYELPYLDRQSDHWKIVNWQNTFRAADTLWLDSLSDRFTGNQLVNVNSALNKSGKNIAEEISRKTGLKCYYNIFNDLTKKVKFTKIKNRIARICPSCNKAMRYIKFCNDYERYICDDCKLSSELPKDEQL